MRPALVHHTKGLLRRRYGRFGLLALAVLPALIVAPLAMVDHTGRPAYNEVAAVESPTATAVAPAATAVPRNEEDAALEALLSGADLSSPDVLGELEARFPRRHEATSEEEQPPSDSPASPRVSVEDDPTMPRTVTAYEVLVRNPRGPIPPRTFVRGPAPVAPTAAPPPPTSTPRPAPTATPRPAPTATPVPPRQPQAGAYAPPQALGQAQKIAGAPSAIGAKPPSAAPQQAAPAVAPAPPAAPPPPPPLPPPPPTATRVPPTQPPAPLVREAPPASYYDADWSDTPAEYAVRERIDNVNITFYDCAVQDFCGAMYNGTQVFNGAAACSWDLEIGTRFVIVGDPLQRLYVCEDRGLLANSWADIFFYHPSDGWRWQGAVGRHAAILIVE